MTTKVVPGLLIATQDAAEAAREASHRMRKTIDDAIRDRGTAAIALSGGNSPLDAYRRLAHEAIDWNRVHVYFVDERAVPASSERSNWGGIHRVLVDPTGIPHANIHRMSGDASDLEDAARSYETELRDTVNQNVCGVPVLDLVILGIGDDGHTASLFPGDPAVFVTDRLVVTVPSTAEREARLTLTVPILENARASLLIVLGKSKHPALERVWSSQGDVGQVPARIVRGFRGSICWVIDRAAAGMG